MEEKEYLTYEEAMEYLGCKRSTLYTLIIDLRIPTHKFKHDKRRYIAFVDVRRMKEVRERPWIVEDKSDNRPS